MDDTNNVTYIKSTVLEDSHTGKYVALPEILWHFYEKMAEERGISVNDMSTAALQWYLKTRTRNKYGYYLAPNGKNIHKFIWIKTGAINKAQAIGASEGTSDDRLLINALIGYYDHCQTTNDFAEIVTFPHKDSTT